VKQRFVISFVGADPAGSVPQSQPSRSTGPFDRGKINLINGRHFKYAVDEFKRFVGGISNQYSNLKHTKLHEKPMC